MSEEDFLQEFHLLEICNLGPDSLDQEVLTDTSKKKWEASIFEGSWVRGATCGWLPQIPRCVFGASNCKGTIASQALPA
ncbi:hypothetical protein HPB48_000622 [Haemaphysalis longicornis]|uniref:Uncharacterized protein n=1 Tax=Haemaphysalis longicornis TaxID=44386 RepID=A0A9J6GPQ5_HAELO|nr:hypothetical protein HPB48_000622 [Haemaphysalis longicornis]